VFRSSLERTRLNAYRHCIADTVPLPGAYERERERERVDPRADPHLLRSDVKRVDSLCRWTVGGVMTLVCARKRYGGSKKAVRR
jgi:hypothetical protein